MRALLLSLFLSFLTNLAAQDFIPYSLFTGETVVPNDKEYYKYKEKNVEIIYPKENLEFAKHTSKVEQPLHKDYEYYYDWKLDETLYVGLISSCNQIANGFSTQWSNNRQINYVGGTKSIDYFASTSWLDTLLYHESAHNYQLNVKASKVSQTLHSVLGNGSLFAPTIIVPNIMENSFMLEGNAVLNESRHGNGGRLYSGRFKVNTLLQAKAGNLTPQNVYNDRLAFPYGDIFYINGGFYNLYMAQKYGLKNINSYFKYHSQDFFWPQYTNYSMKMATGVDFESSLKAFADKYAQEAQNVVLAKGEKIASSQFFYPLSNDADEIFFLINETGRETPKLVIVDKDTLDVTKQSKSFFAGKVIKENGEYFTQASAHTSVSKISQGLFDEDGFIKQGSDSQMVQGYLSDGRAVYFDVPSSYSQAQLYVGQEFYAQVNSSVFIDKDDNLYYFKQEKKERSLYKNKTKLNTFKGFYSIVSGVDSEGGIYFVANSKYGSSLYCFKNEKITRVSEADNIVEARLLNDKELLIAAINDKEYYYIQTQLTSNDEAPYETVLFFEDKEYYGGYTLNEEDAQHVDLSHPYNSFLDMHYSGSDLFFSTTDNGTTGSLEVKFADPLSQNAASLFVSRDDSNITLTGINYASALYSISYMLSAYHVLDDDNKKYVRENGIVLSTNYALYQKGYYTSSFGINYYQDYYTYEREPLSFIWNFMRARGYGVSAYYNDLNSISLYTALLENDKIYGAKYEYAHDIADELYFGANFKYSQMDSNIHNYSHGVKITSSAYQIDMDPSAIYIPSLNIYYYVQNAGYAEASLTQVLNFSAYYFTFPLSLQRESLYLKYRYYDIKDFTQKEHPFSESTLGISFFTVVLNSLTIPVNLEYIHNNSDFIKDKDQVKFNIGIGF